MAEYKGTVILAGATGYIGRAVTSELIGRGYRVVALVRAMPARLLVAAVSLAGNGAAPLVCRWHAAPQMHAPAPRNARA